MVYIIIPARLNSKRFPGKALASIAGEPLTYRVFQQAMQCKCADKVFVASEDQEIMQSVDIRGGHIAIMRKSYRSGTDKCADLANIHRADDDDIVVNIQGDNALFDPALVDDLVQQLSDPAVIIATPISKIKTIVEAQDVNTVKVVSDKNMDALYFSRAVIPYPRDEETMPTYFKHIGIYAFRKRALDAFAGFVGSDLERIEKLEQLRILQAGQKIRCMITDRYAMSVDCPSDIQAVERVMSQMDMDRVTRGDYH